LPQNLRKVFQPNNTTIYADFEVCPLEPEQAGAMQAACIEVAKNVVLDRLD
jgi:hypothetical protein